MSRRSSIRHVTASERIIGSKTLPSIERPNSEDDIKSSPYARREVLSFTLLPLLILSAAGAGDVFGHVTWLVHLGSANRVLPSAFSYRNSHAASFAFRGGFGKYK